MEDLIKKFLSLGDGWGSGDGDGSGDSSGSGSGSGILNYNGADVYIVDGIQTLIAQVRGNVARGAVLKGDLTTQPCYIVKAEGRFAHGETLHEAFEALNAKLIKDLPPEERVKRFAAEFKTGQEYPNMSFFEWHHRLTGSCEMGRRRFAQDHGISLDDSMTPEEFIRLTENAFGGSTIKKLKTFYPALRSEEVTG